MCPAVVHKNTQKPQKNQLVREHLMGDKYGVMIVSSLGNGAFNSNTSIIHKPLTH